VQKLLDSIRKPVREVVERGNGRIGGREGGREGKRDGCWVIDAWVNIDRKE